MEDPRRHRTPPTAWSWSRRAAPGVGAALLSAGLAGCGVLATPGSPTVAGSRPASAGPVGYVVCPSAVTPIELASRTSEPPIALPIHGTPPLGDFAVTLSPDGKWAFVVTQTTPPGGATTNVLVPVDLATQRARPPIVLPGLTVSSVSSPHGLVASADGSTLYLGGQGHPDYGGRVVAVSVATGAVTASTGFDRFGISDPAALALTPDGSQLLVADSADNWIDTVPVADFANPLPPVRLPGGAASGTDHPTDIVTGPGSTGAFIVTGLGSVLPYDPVHQTFGRAIRVCSGASSLSAGGSP